MNRQKFFFKESITLYLFYNLCSYRDTELKFWMKFREVAKKSFYKIIIIINIIVKLIYHSFRPESKIKVRFYTVNKLVKKLKILSLV